MSWRTILVVLSLCAAAEPPVDAGQKGPARLYETQEEAKDLIGYWLALVWHGLDYKGFSSGEISNKACDLWVDKAVTLKEFFGTKDEAEIKWTSIEKDLLKALREDIKDNPFFTEQLERSLQARHESYEEKYWDKPTKRHVELRGKIQKWLDTEVARRVTPEMEAKWKWVAGAGHLHSFMGDDIVLHYQVVYQTPAGKAAGRELTGKYWYAYKKLFDLGVFEFKGELGPEKIKGLNELEKLLYEYCRAAFPNNVLFKVNDAEHQGPDTTALYQKYKKYCDNERPDAERRAYEQLWNYLTAELQKLPGAPEPALPPPPLSNRRRWPIIAGVALIVAAALGAGLVWRLRKRSPTPT